MRVWQKGAESADDFDAGEDIAGFEIPLDPNGSFWWSILFFVRDLQLIS